jgi:ectoine hydroxylase-related dioxygenase (phytanoyl-CoA dioxygenase family)
MKAKTPQSPRPKSASKPKPLSAEQVRFFHEEGYLIVPDVFDPADLEPLRQEMAAAIDGKVRALKAEGKLTRLHAKLDFEHRLAALYRDSQENGEAVMRHLEGMRSGGFRAPEMFEVIAHPKLLAKVSSLLGTQEIVASSVYRLRPKLPNIGRGIVPWHQDSGYFAAACDEHLIITCWVPLVDATAENGCMQILPRTHRGAVAEHHTGGNAGFLVIPDENLPADPRHAITAACPRGGVVFMTNRTPHCSTPNYSDHVRWSIDLRYQSAEVPNNVAAMPKKIDEAGNADPEFYEKVTVACYPPEADFVVQSRANPKAVSDYREYVRRRETYEHVKTGYAPIRHWPNRAKAPAAKS